MIDIGGRDVLARLALADVPKILTLQDRNPFSPTYGCFDRNFWHFRLQDFPSGMAQEFVYPLALAHSLDLTDNPYRDSPAVRDWIVAGMRFAARSSHDDGSCDDYYPFERAAGATAFSLLAGLESYRILDLDDGELLAFFRRRAGWLARHRESGRLSNHEALVVSCLDRLQELDGSASWTEAIERRLARLLSWQTAEGWFWEYGGCDPGYLTLTIGLLAELDRRHPHWGLREPLRRAVDFVSHFVHPDGTFGGEYGSRNTYNFFPHGFEVAGAWLPGALAVNDEYIRGLAAGRGPCFADDHIIGHHVWSYLLACRDYVSERPPPELARDDGRAWFPEAGLMVEKRGPVTLFAALNKGGVFKVFRDDQLICSDTQLALRVADGRRTRTAVAHLVDPDNTIELSDTAMTVAGDMGWAKHTQMTLWRGIVLRLVMVTIGRFGSDFVRKLLQRLLIVGKRAAPFRFERRFEWQEDGLTVRDQVRSLAWDKVIGAGISGHATSIYVVMSRTFQVSQLQPEVDLLQRVRDLRPDMPLVLERKF